jgi:hypothetical protein
MHYDDNFGNWEEPECQEDREEKRKFYKQVQDASVWKVCSLCDQEVKLLPHYDKCDSCMRKLESGMEW